MYTSGSTGLPKGVMMSHKNIMSTLKSFCDEEMISSDDVLLGILPLAHIFELLFENLFFLLGAKVGYSSPLTMLDTSGKNGKGSTGDVSILKPTVVIGVPVSKFIRAG